MSDYIIAKQSLKEENKAIADYQDRLKAAKDPKVKAAVRHALPEEKEHARLFSDAAISVAKKLRGGE